MFAIMNVADIRYTQDTINDTFSKGIPIEWTVYMLKKKKINPIEIPTITVVYYNGYYRSLNNRRLYCFKKSGIKQIPVKFKSKIPPHKHTSTNNGKSVRVRCGATHEVFNPNDVVAVTDPTTGNIGKWTIRQIVVQTKKLKLNQFYDCKVCGIRKMSGYDKKCHLNGKVHKKNAKINQSKNTLTKNPPDSLRKNMQYIAYNNYSFSLSALPNIYMTYFQIDIKVVFNGKLKELVKGFQDIFKIEYSKDNNQTYLTSKIYNIKTKPSKPTKANKKRVNKTVQNTNAKQFDPFNMPEIAIWKPKRNKAMINGVFVEPAPNSSKANKQLYDCKVCDVKKMNAYDNKAHLKGHRHKKKLKDQAKYKEREDILRKNMEHIAYNNHRVSLETLPFLYMAYFQANINDIFDAELKKLAIHFKDLFVLEEDNSSLYLVSKIFQIKPKPTQTINKTATNVSIKEFNALQLRCKRLEKNNQELIKLYKDEKNQIKIMEQKIRDLTKALLAKEDEFDDDYKSKD